MRKTAWWVLLLAIVGLAAACKEVPTQSAPAAPTGACANPKAAPSGPITISSGGLQRTYLLSLPSPLPTKPAPVIVNLHGAGSDKEQQAVYSQLAVKGPARGFVVVTPDATGQPQQWNIIGQTKSDDVKFIDDLIVDRRDPRVHRPDSPLRHGNLERCGDELSARLQGRANASTRSRRSRGSCSSGRCAAPVRP